MKYIGHPIINCEKCGRLINPRRTKRKYCIECSKYQPIVYKTFPCSECGDEVVVDARNTTKTRCDECQKEHIKKYDRERKRNKNI